MGFLGATTPADATPWLAAFVKRLGELGWIEGSTVTIEYRWAESRGERYAEIGTARSLAAVIDVSRSVSSARRMVATLVAQIRQMSARMLRGCGCRPPAPARPTICKSSSRLRREERRPDQGPPASVGVSVGDF